MRVLRVPKAPISFETEYCRKNGESVRLDAVKSNPENKMGLRG